MASTNWIWFGPDLAQNLIYQTVCMYLLIFYTNVYGLEPSAAAFMFLIVRVVDVLWDPLVGAFVDKHNPKLGKYRSYLILAGIPLTGLRHTLLLERILRLAGLCILYLCRFVYALHAD